MSYPHKIGDVKLQIPRTTPTTLYGGEVFYFILLRSPCRNLGRFGGSRRLPDATNTAGLLPGIDFARIPLIETTGRPAHP